MHSTLFLTVTLAVLSVVDCRTVEQQREQIIESLHVVPISYHFVAAANAVCLSAVYRYVNSLEDVASLLEVTAKGTDLELMVSNGNVTWVSKVDNDIDCRSMDGIPVFPNRTYHLCSWFRETMISLPQTFKVTLRPRSKVGYILHFSDTLSTYHGQANLPTPPSDDVLRVESFASNYCSGDKVNACPDCENSCTRRLTGDGPVYCRSQWHEDTATRGSIYGRMTSFNIHLEVGDNNDTLGDNNDTSSPAYSLTPSRPIWHDTPAPEKIPVLWIVAVVCVATVVIAISVFLLLFVQKRKA